MGQAAAEMSNMPLLTNDQHTTSVDFFNDSHPAEYFNFRRNDSSPNPSKGEASVHWGFGA